MRLELTKRADYAIRTVLALARVPDTSRMSVDKVAALHAVPKPFLQQVMRDLVRAGLVEGIVGRAGGYRLAKSPNEISLLDVVEAVEGDSRRRGCVMRGGPCMLDAVCEVHPVFAAAQDNVLGRLRDATLAEVVRTSLVRTTADSG